MQLNKETKPNYVPVNFLSLKNKLHDKGLTYMARLKSKQNGQQMKQYSK